MKLITSKFQRSVVLVSIMGLCTGPAYAQSSKALENEVKELRQQVEELREIIDQILDVEKTRYELLEARMRRISTGRRRASPPRRNRSPNPRAPSLDRGETATQVPVVVDSPPRSAAPGLDANPRPRAARNRRSDGGKGIVNGFVRMPGNSPVAYVFVENLPGRMVRGKKVQITQYNKKFRPNWAVIRKGTTVEFPNNDDVYHNVFSLSPRNTFDLGLYRKGDGSKAYRFVNAGVVDVYCNIHPKMVASILVVPNQYFTKVKKNGAFALNNVPRGRRKIVAWAPGTELGVQWVEVGGDNIDLSFDLKPRSSAHKNKRGLPYGSYQ